MKCVNVYNNLIKREQVQTRENIRKLRKLLAYVILFTIQHYNNNKKKNYEKLCIVSGFMEFSNCKKIN